MWSAAASGATSPLGALARCIPGGESVWVHSTHVVNFDVGEGHVLEWSSSSSTLSRSDLDNLCLQAMPDSQPASGGLGDMRFTFRFLCESGSRDTNKPLWGLSFFRARRTPDARRGVFQKAFVLLTPLPLFELCRAIVAQLAETYFGAGVDALRDALKQIHQWPVHASAGTHELSLLGRTLTVRCVPCEPGPVYALAQPVLGDAVREVRNACALCSLGESCWTLWQLMLTGESLVVLTPSPHQCSDIVLALPALIAPLVCMSDMRPYLSVHAPDWEHHLSGAGPPQGSGVLAGAWQLVGCGRTRSSRRGKMEACSTRGKLLTHSPVLRARRRNQSDACPRAAIVAHSAYFGGGARGRWQC